MPPTLKALLPVKALLREPAFQKIFWFDRLRDLFESARRAGGEAGPIANLLSLLDIRYRIDPAELERVPRTGPLLIVANHPFGFLEGAILATELKRVRPDVRILTNAQLAAVPELRDQCIFIDPFGDAASVPANAAALRRCCVWLREGGVLVVFPAGEVAHGNPLGHCPVDPPWNPSTVRLAQRTGAAALPVFFAGSNSPAFHLAGAVHPGLRTASLPRELLNKRGRTIRVRIGRPVSHATLESFRSDEATEYLRCRTYLLEGGSERSDTFRLLLPRKSAPVAAGPPPILLAREIERLAPERLLCESGEFAVYLGSSAEMPLVVREIGRLRELTFRRAGEGTGRAIDLDRFDRHYLHLLLWNRAAGEIAGAYRLAPTPDVLPGFGIGGLYTSTLFRYHRALFDRVGPALELGRSFIRPEYQKQYAPLLLLWKGIGRYVNSRPECASLFGAVSISSRYNAVSRQLIVKYLEAQRVEELAPLVAPRRPYRPDGRLLRRTGQVARIPADIEQLSGLVADLESDGKGVPILIKQYLKAGGRLLGFNVDAGFSGVLDALIMVDLRRAPVAIRERYLGKDGAAAFAAWHGLDSASQSRDQTRLVALGR
jgi:putative hemolysin